MHYPCSFQPECRRGVPSGRHSETLLAGAATDRQPAQSPARTCQLVSSTGKIRDCDGRRVPEGPDPSNKGSVQRIPWTTPWSTIHARLRELQRILSFLLLNFDLGVPPPHQDEGLYRLPPFAVLHA
jgi:hypothetical protein